MDPNLTTNSLLHARSQQRFVVKNFLTPTFGLRGENKTKQDITVFITAIMTYKRLRLPAPNDYYRTWPVLLLWLWRRRD